MQHNLQSMPFRLLDANKGFPDANNLKTYSLPPFIYKSNPVL